MAKQFTQRTWKHAASLVMVLAAALCGFYASAESDEAVKARADLLDIDAMKVMGELERAPVIFPHDKHTAALKTEGKDCSTCHEKKDGYLVPMFRRVGGEKNAHLMDHYHNECIGCHQQRWEKEMVSGPVTCGDCHQRDPEYTSSRQPVDFDKSLHARHVKAQNKVCTDCHHEGIDPKTKKPFPGKHREQNCRDCHKKVWEEKRSPMRYAAHSGCIKCHLEKAAKGKKSGPTVCAGCHDATMQAKYEVLKQIPRLERDQPTKVVINTAKKTGAKPHYPPVPFNHQLHEVASDSCRVCHHEGMKRCNECHTSKGKKEGGGVTAEISMHAVSTDHSCIGCHNKQKEKSECASCHSFHPMLEVPKSSCTHCHVEQTKPIESSTTEESTEVAAVETITEMRGLSFTPDVIPETVDIKILEKKYQPAKMPHKKIIDKLIKMTKDSKLASHFHGTEDALCAGCHHNSPVGKKPPACSSCHAKPFDTTDIYRPGILGAYHQQCIGCHKQLNFENPTKCTTCHKQK